MSAAREALDRASEGVDIPWCTIGKAVHNAIEVFASSGDKLWHRLAARVLLPLVKRELDERCGEKPGERGVPDHMRLDP